MRAPIPSVDYRLPIRIIPRDAALTAPLASSIRPTMYWTLELATYLEDAPWPASKEELIDFCDRTGAPIEVIQNLSAIEDDGEPYESIEEVWPDFPTADDDFYYEEE